MIEPGLWVILLPAALLALGTGWLIGRRSSTAQAQELLLAQERYQALQERFDELQDERQQGQQKLDQQQTLLIKLTARLKDAEATLRSERLAAAEKLQLQQEAEQRLSQQFENLANRIFEQNSGNFRELNQNSLDLLLTPLKEQLEGFRRQVGRLTRRRRPSATVSSSSWSASPSSMPA